MENITAEQLEALETMAEFNERLLKNLPTLITELSGNRQPDTDQYQKSIIDAINWEIAVINSTLEVLNQGKVRIHKEDFNQKVIALNSAISSKEDSGIAGALEMLIPCFEQLGKAIRETIN